MEDDDRGEWEECFVCWGKGGRDNDDLMEEDPLWYDGVEWETCEECHGKGGWYVPWTQTSPQT